MQDVDSRLSARRQLTAQQGDAYVSYCNDPTLCFVSGTTLHIRWLACCTGTHNCSQQEELNICCSQSWLSHCSSSRCRGSRAYHLDALRLSS